MSIITDDLRTRIDRIDAAAARVGYGEALRDVLLAITPRDSFDVILDKIRALADEYHRRAKEGK